MQWDCRYFLGCSEGLNQETFQVAHSISWIGNFNLSVPTGCIPYHEALEILYLILYWLWTCYCNILCLCQLFPSWAACHKWFLKWGTGRQPLETSSSPKIKLAQIKDTSGLASTLNITGGDRKKNDISNNFVYTIGCVIWLIFGPSFNILHLSLH